MRRGWIMASVVAATAAQADEGPSFDCARAEGEVETLICGEADIAALDRRLAETWAEVIDVAEGLDERPDMDALRAEQRGWIKGRNDCWKADDAAACVTDAYEVRISTLAARWMLAPETGAARYVCEGNPANAFHASFRDTLRPSVRIEYGDGVKVGVQTRTASGARYEMPFGAFLWTKGDAATFAWEEGRELTCEVAE